MSYESNTGLNVSNHYGPRAIGGEQGSQVTKDGRRLYTFDVPVVDGTLVQDIPVPAGALVENVDVLGTAAVTTLLVGALDVSAATWGVGVPVVDEGFLTGTFTGDGTVVVTVLNVAS